MRARTILLFCTPAVIAAVAVAVPALAGSSRTSPSRGAASHASVATPNAHTSAKAHCFYTGKGRHRTRTCEIAGPAGPRGPRGFVGAHGKRGFSGPAGSTGATGPGGVARAYALVGVRAGLQLVPAFSREFVSVIPVSTGVFCLVPSAGTRVNEVAAAVSGESSLSASGVIPLAVLNAGHPNCGEKEFEVETYRLNGKSGPELSNEVAFTIVVP
jgi:hypothetical protein